MASSELSIGIRSGAAKPDIRTPDALKRALGEAKSITYPQDGASRGDIEKMFERLGIAAEVAPKIILAPGQDRLRKASPRARPRWSSRCLVKLCRFPGSRLWVRFQVNFILRSDSARL